MGKADKKKVDLCRKLEESSQMEIGREREKKTNFE